jgi:hypothetical protein
MALIAFAGYEVIMIKGNIEKSESAFIEVQTYAKNVKKTAKEVKKTEKEVEFIFKKIKQRYKQIPRLGREFRSNLCSNVNNCCDTFLLLAVRFHHVVPYLQKSHSETYQAIKPLPMPLSSLIIARTFTPLQLRTS